MLSMSPSTHPTELYNLSVLLAGEQAIISAISAEPALQHRLNALGFKVGKSIKVMRRARFNGPIHVRLGATDVILRPNDAKRIHLHQ